MVVAFHNLCPLGLRIASRIRPVSCFSLNAKVNGRKARTNDVSVVSFAAPGLIANLIVITDIARPAESKSNPWRGRYVVVIDVVAFASYPAPPRVLLTEPMERRTRIMKSRVSRPHVTISSCTSSPGSLSAAINNGSVKYARVVAHEWGIWDTLAGDVNHGCAKRFSFVAFIKVSSNDRLDKRLIARIQNGVTYINWQKSD